MEKTDVSPQLMMVFIHQVRFGIVQYDMTG